MNKLDFQIKWSAIITLSLMISLIMTSFIPSVPVIFPAILLIFFVIVCAFFLSVIIRAGSDGDKL